MFALFFANRTGIRLKISKVYIVNIDLPHSFRRRREYSISRRGTDAGRAVGASQRWARPLCGRKQYSDGHDPLQGPAICNYAATTTRRSGHLEYTQHQVNGALESQSSGVSELPNERAAFRSVGWLRAAGVRLSDAHRCLQSAVVRRYRFAGVSRRWEVMLNRAIMH